MLTNSWDQIVVAARIMMHKQNEIDDAGLSDVGWSRVES